jgi:hypothetical protein
MALTALDQKGFYYYIGRLEVSTTPRALTRRVVVFMSSGTAACLPLQVAGKKNPVAPSKKWNYD